jgi:site-specific DNA-methyltransferase (adenine-specific)
LTLQNFIGIIFELFYSTFVTMELVPISKVKANPANPRTIKDDKFAKLVESLKNFPEMANVRPIIVNAEMVALGGNMRLKAMKEAGWKQVPVTVVDWPEAKQREFIIKDNVGFGDWDWDTLANEWDAEPLEDWGLDVPGFDMEVEAEEDDFDVPEGGIETDIVICDLFEIGEHRLLCGDSTQTDTFKKLFAGQMADLVVTDPPYNVDYTGKTKDALKIENDKKDDGDFYQFLYDFYTALGSYTKAGGSWYVWHADLEGHNFRKAFKDCGFKMSSVLVWNKQSMVMGRSDYQWKHEPCIYGWKDGSAHGWYSDRKQTTVLNFDRPQRNAEHPTMKPIPLFAYQISNSSKQGDIVADGFGGSGTTMVACHQMQRKAYLVEYDPKYCQVIVDRMLKLDPTIEIKKNGEPFKNSQ